MQIRVATAEDAHVLANFNLRLAQETEGKILDTAKVQSGVCNGLKQGPEVQYFVAVANNDTIFPAASPGITAVATAADSEPSGQIVGQLMLTREWSNWHLSEDAVH